MALVPRYFRRLQINQELLVDFIPTIDNLRTICEQHLLLIPFENLAQHGGAGGRVVLNIAAIAEKLLDRMRGGFCVELNGLLAVLLEELGYRIVRVPAIVYKDDVGFNRETTHMFLIVRCPPEASLYFVDVGFGEPPIHPLPYDSDTFNKEHTTSEGMVSKLILLNGRVTLYWKISNEWRPRLQWDYSASMMAPDEGPDLQAFQPELCAVQQEDSNFSKKMIICSLSRTRKQTIAGNRFKVTGPPRFEDPPIATNVRTETLSTTEEIRQKIWEVYGIPMVETNDLDLDKSIQSDLAIWSQF